MYHNHAPATAAAACTARGRRPSPASAEGMARLLPALMSSGAAWIQWNCHQSGSNSSFLLYVQGREGQRSNQPRSSSDASHRRWVWLLGCKTIFCLKARGCEQTHSSSEDGDQQASRRRSVPRGVEVSFQTDDQLSKFHIFV